MFKLIKTINYYTHIIILPTTLKQVLLLPDPILISKIGEYVTLWDKRDSFADVIKLRILRWDYSPGLPMWALSVILKIHVRKKQDGECDLMTEMQTGVRQQGTKDHWKHLEARRGKKQILPGSRQKEPTKLTP